LLYDIIDRLWWSSGQSSWLQIRRSRVRFPALQKKVVGLERGPLSLVGATEELLGSNSSGSSLESREYGCRDSSRWPRGTLYPQKVGTNFVTSGGRSVGIGRLWTEAMEFFYDIIILYIILGAIYLIYFRSTLQTLYNLHYTPTTLRVQSWREITSEGKRTENVWIPQHWITFTARMCTTISTTFRRNIPWRGEIKANNLLPTGYMLTLPPKSDWTLMGLHGATSQQICTKCFLFAHHNLV
jgi:hypothetical protein